MGFKVIIDSLENCRDYRVALLDPPWKYYGDPNKDQAAGKHYSCMSYEQLAALRIKEIMHKKSVVLCWTTASKLAESCDLVRDWGFHFRGMFQVWIKTTNGGKIIHAQGVRPSIVKPTIEYIIAASTLEKGRPLELLSERIPNAVFAPRPGGVHSRKPAVFKENIVKTFGDVKRIELFSRDSTEGWDCWGNEVGKYG